MRHVREPNLEKGPPHPQDPRTAREKPQCQGGGFTPFVRDPDLGTGTPLHKGFRPIREGRLELCERRPPSADSGCSESGSRPPSSSRDSLISDNPRSLPETWGQDSRGPRPEAVDGPGREGQRGEEVPLVHRHRGERRGSELGLPQDTQRGGEDAESGGEMLGQGERRQRRDSGLELQKETERGGEDAESGGEMLLGQGERRQRDSGLELQEETERGGEDAESGGEMLVGQGERRQRHSGLELQEETERGGEDAESGGEMLLGGETPGRREALEGSGTEQRSLIPRRTPQGSPQRSPGEKRTRLPPTVTLSSRVLLVLCALCALLLLLVLTFAVLTVTGRSSSQDVPISPRLETCPMDWLYSRHTCYYFSMIYKEKRDWDESQRFCSSHNGSLALFNTQEELNFLMDISSEHHAWVGLRRRQDGIHWANGSTCSSSLCSITDFGDCAYIGLRAVGLSSCGLFRPYICTKEPYV